MCAFFAKLLNAPTEPSGKSFNDPIFLVGLMRSGTTLLMNTLSEHPQLLKVGFELNKVWTDIGGAPCSVNCNERTEHDFNPVYANNMTSYFTEYIENSKTVKGHLARWFAKRHYGSGGIFYDWENVRVMNKSPHLSNKIRYINAMYPNAKYIVIVRSIEGQCASLKMHFMKHYEQGDYAFYLPEGSSACWTNLKGDEKDSVKKNRIYPSNFELLPEAWVRLNGIIFKHLEKVSDNQKIIFSYEELLQEKEKTLTRIFDFLELEDKHYPTVQKIVSKERKVHNTTTQGDPIKKWKKHLSSEELGMIEKVSIQYKEEISWIKSHIS